MFLYLPRRNESEIIKPFSSATEALRQKEPLLQIINFANDLQKLIQQLQLLDSLYNITNFIAPGTSNSDDTSSSDIDTEFSAVDVSSAAPTRNIDPDLAENIHDTSLPHKTMTIRVITKLPNSEQSYKGKVKTHNYINRQNQSTTGKL